MRSYEYNKYVLNQCKPWQYSNHINYLRDNDKTTCIIFNHCTLIVSHKLFCKEAQLKSLTINYHC